MKRMDRQEFEERYAKVTSPMPVIRMGLTPETVLELPGMKDIDFVQLLVEKLAQANDVESLQMLRDEGHLNRFHVNGPWTKVTYAVAHMLIDGAGNEAFASDWMNDLGHTRENAVKMFVELWEDAEETLWREQQRLGVATIADVFTIDSSEGPPLTPVHLAWRNVEGSEGTQIQQAMELAYLMRYAHPDGMPQLEVRADRLGTYKHVPLSDLMFAGEELKHRHLLPAVELAYGTENAGVRATMRGSIELMLKSKKLSIETRVEESFQWDAMQLWGDEDLGKRIWQSVIAPGKSFIDTIQRLNSPLTYIRLEQAIAMGADIQAPCDPIGLGGAQALRLMDLAVQMRDPTMVGYLLGKGCDPELKSVDRDTIKTFSAVSMIMGLDPDSPDEMAPAETKRIQDMLRMHLAKKAALGVIDELEAPAKQGAKP